MPTKQKQDTTILVPIDFSKSSEAALVLGAELAQCMRARLCVLHVVHDPAEAPGYYRIKGRKSDLRRLEDIAREMMNDFVARVAAEHGHLKRLKQAELELVVGIPVTRILEVVDKVKPRMVVMGSAGRTGLSHLFLGSKAEHMVRLCPVPVTIVKRPKHARRVREARND